MKNDLKEIAGGDPLDMPADADRAACKAALAPIIRNLLGQGMSTSSIITALAELTVMTVDRHRCH